MVAQSIYLIPEIPMGSPPTEALNTSGI